ncbi:Uncharacterized protein TCM_009618 [Theobroma cacao]|uniref:Endonuclease/exonuclease/phosphatase domain-containing protein n=1 Tax=Theobroma cacao TaxID=3641 RepID=A0A061E6W5_THECC|nr:Uncharacterized protein TCM_009618 [Theobroma cacao]
MKEAVVIVPIEGEEFLTLAVGWSTPLAFIYMHGEWDLDKVKGVKVMELIVPVEGDGLVRATIRTLVDESVHASAGEKFKDYFTEPSARATTLLQGDGHLILESLAGHNQVDSTVACPRERMESYDDNPSYLESASSKFTYNKEVSVVPSFSRTNLAELKVHPLVWHRRHLNTAASIGRIISLASEKAVDMGENDGVFDDDSISVMLLDHVQCLQVKLSMPWLELPLLASFIYVKCTRSKWMWLWDCLRSLAVDIHTAWFVGGDFNTVLHSVERLNGAVPHGGCMEDFAATLLDCGLKDVGYEGNPFTWTILECFSGWIEWRNNHQWADYFSSTRIQHLNKDGSDHCPLLISCTKL